jgi:hypothetical protein
MGDPCKFEEKINEMHGDLKVLVSEFKSMNGSLRETKQGFNEHKHESTDYRNKVNIMWASIHTIKWAVGLLFGAGMIWKILELLMK